MKYMKVTMTLKTRSYTTKIECADALSAIRELLSHISHGDAESLQEDVDSFVKEGQRERVP